MWSMVLGLPVGILIAVLILPVYPPGFGAYALIVLLLSLAAAVVCLRYGYPALRALRQISVLLAASLAGVGLGTFVEQRLTPWGLQPGTTYYLTGTVSGVPKWGKYSRRYWLESECVGTRADRCDVFQNFLTLLWPVVVELTVSNPKVELQPGQTVRIQVQARSSRQEWNLEPRSQGKCTLGKHRPLCTCPHTCLRICFGQQHDDSKRSRRRSSHPPAKTWLPVTSSH